MFFCRFARCLAQCDIFRKVRAYGVPPSALVPFVVSNAASWANDRSAALRAAARRAHSARGRRSCLKVPLGIDDFGSPQLFATQVASWQRIGDKAAAATAAALRTLAASGADLLNPIEQAASVCQKINAARARVCQRANALCSRKAIPSEVAQLWQYVAQPEVGVLRESRNVG